MSNFPLESRSASKVAKNSYINYNDAIIFHYGKVYTT